MISTKFQGKPVLKKILFSIISLFLAHRSVELLKALWILEAAEIDWTIQFLLAFLLNLFITGIFAFLGFAYPTNRILGEKYYHIDHPRSIKTWSKLLQLEYYKRFLLLIFWGKDENRRKYFDGTRQGLDNFDFQTRQSEFGHLLALVFVQLAVFIILIQGHYIIATVTTGMNIVANFYPIMLQREHRMNIIRIRNLLKTRPTSYHP